MPEGETAGELAQIDPQGPELFDATNEHKRQVEQRPRIASVGL
jgi:hypothetical protein